MNKQYDTDCNVAMPAAQVWRSRRCTYPFEKMAVGESFFAAAEDGTRAWNAARAYARRHAGWAYTARREGGGVRIWRVACAVQAVAEAPVSDLAALLREWRGLHGWSIAEAAAQMGVPAQTWHGWERGKRCSGAPLMMAFLRGLISEQRASAAQDAWRRGRAAPLDTPAPEAATRTGPIRTANR